MSGAIFAPEISYPAIIAHEMGLQSYEFRTPVFNAFGGLPVNLEHLLRRLEERYGRDINVLELLSAPVRLRGWMDEAEDYWERGGGTRPSFPAGPFHNLASWGMTVDDALFLTAGECQRRCAEPARDNLFNQVPDNAFFRTALTVLNPAQRRELDASTVLDAVAALAGDSGIENLIVNLGSNNALGTITQLRVLPTDERVLDDPIGTRTLFNLWRPEHFADRYRRMAAKLATLDIEHVFLATVPHVTIAPLARGVGRGSEFRLPDDPRYFQFYTYYWINDAAFRPDEHPHLTGEQARVIDETIDQFNATIRDVVEQQQAAGRAWFVVDIADALERIAYRRYQEIGQLPPGGLYVFPPKWLAALRASGLPVLTTEYLTTTQGRLARGGLFSLDGVHATTMGYSLIAHEFIQVMRDQAQVVFRAGVTGAARPDPITINYTRLLQRDTLVRTPPGLLDDGLRILNWLEDWVGLGSILGRLA